MADAVNPRTALVLYKGLRQIIAPGLAQPPQYFWAPTLGIAYCVNQKVASSAIRRALLAVEAPELENRDIFSRRLRRRFIRRRPPADARLVFSFVRHPVERLASLWRNKFAEIGDGKFELATYLFGRLRREMSFEELAEAVCTIKDHHADRHFRSQVVNLQMHRNPPDIVGRIETIQKDWEELQARVPGLPELRAANTSSAAVPTLPDALLERLWQRYAQDFEQFYPDEAWARAT